VERGPVGTDGSAGAHEGAALRHSARRARAGPAREGQSMRNEHTAEEATGGVAYE